MEKLADILKDLEQGKISADNAESKVLRLFNVSGQVCDHPKEARTYWQGETFCVRCKTTIKQ